MDDDENLADALKHAREHNFIEARQRAGRGDLSREEIAANPAHRLAIGREIVRGMVGDDAAAAWQCSDQVTSFDDFARLMTGDTPVDVALTLPDGEEVAPQPTPGEDRNPSRAR